MPRRRNRREPGRPTLLDRDVEQKLIEATKIGAPMGAAAEYSGIAVRTFEDWMRRGYNESTAREDGEEPDATEQKYLDLYEKVRSARAHAAVASVGLIRKVAVGGTVTEETTRKYRDADGQVVEEKTVKRTPPDWRASAWYLERQHRGDFGKQDTVSVEHSGEVGVSVKAGDLASRVRANIEAAREKEAALQIEMGKGDGDDIVDADVVE